MEMALSNLQPLNSTELTRSSKYLLPTIFSDNSITENGFVNVYNKDVNRPWLDDHIFVVYETTLERGSFYKIMTKHPLYYDTKYSTIDGIGYTLYIFKPKPELREAYSFILDGNVRLADTEVKKSIIQFWPIYLPELMDRAKHTPIEDIIPEEDEWVDPLDRLIA